MDSLKTIEKLPIEEQIKMKMEIINSFEMAMDIPSIYLPETYSNKYFFISYSQKDFKKVYLDLFRLGQQDIHYWYDRGNPGGKDWPDVVKRNIAPFQCKGVIFYISENSLTSLSVDNEMKIIKDLGKPYIPITLPFEKDYVYKGENVKGKEYPVSVMIDILFENGKIDKKKANRLHKYFSDKTLYLHLNMPDVSKAEKINLSIPAVPLLVGKCNGKGYFDKLYIEKINDSSIEEITKLDFIELLTYLKKDLDKHYKIIFLPSCLANCRYLKTIEISKMFSIERIEMHAFANDEHFVGFKGIKKLECEILDGAFYNCSSFAMDIDIKQGNRIGSFTFFNCSSLPNLVIPEGIKTIGEYAFFGCNGLILLGIPDTVTRIEEGAFEECTRLDSVLLGKNVAYIGQRSFYNCTSLRRFEMCDNVSYVGKNVFLGCNSLEFYEKGNVNYLGNSNNHYVYAYGAASKDKRVSLLERCRLINDKAFERCSFHRTNLVIPDSCVFIGNSAFSACDNLRTVSIPNSVVSFGDSMFERCRSLEKVVWPNSLKTIPKSTFEECSFLSAFEFCANSSLTSIEERAFSGCLSLYEIVLPNSIVSIKENAFYGCFWLSSISLPSELEEIGNRAFMKCEMLKSINLPDHVTMIGESAFAKCSSLKEITFTKTKEAWKTLNKLWFINNSFNDYDLDDDTIDSSIGTPDIWASYGSVEVIHCIDGDIRRDDVLDDCYSDTLTFNDGNEEIELKKIGQVNYQNHNYIFVRPVDDEDIPEDAVYILEVVGDNNSREYYTISDEALAKKLFSKFAEELNNKQKN